MREVAVRDKEARFTALLHHVTVSRLRWACRAISPKAAPGAGGVAWAACGQDLGVHLQDLHGRVQQGRYRASPSRRAYIAKADGRQRPPGMAALEDKIVQRAVVEVLTAVCEVGFPGFWYGFRPRRGPHQALDALAAGIMTRKVNWVLDAGIRDFSGQLDRDWLREFPGHRIADKRVLAGLSGRFAKFGPELHPDKTRLAEFGRRAARDRAARGEGKPETFAFLGFTHICANSRRGRFRVRRKTSANKVRAKLAEVKAEIRRRRCLPIPEQGKWLASVVRGHQAYYAVPGNSDAVNAFRTQVARHWYKALRRRSQKTTITWIRMNRIVTRWLPKTRILHPFPEARFAATHPR